MALQPLSGQPASILTLTLNPAIDVGYSVDRLVPTHKMRTRGEYYTPGGGGINVARVLHRLGSASRCLYLAGGATGAMLDELLDEEGVANERLAIAGHTRICMTAFAQDNGQEYRFVPPGPTVSEPEWRACLARLEATRADYCVASGSLPQGVPEGFYAEVSRIAAARGMRFVLDSSGAALRHGLEAGGIMLVKPSLGELAEYCGRSLDSAEAAGQAAMAIIDAGKAQMVAVTMGQNGAVLASCEGVHHMPAIRVETRSALGAGDSFLAGMVHGLARGAGPMEALTIGGAAGAAAALSPGGGLCEARDVERLIMQNSAAGERFCSF